MSDQFLDMTKELGASVLALAPFIRTDSWALSTDIDLQLKNSLGQDSECGKHVRTGVEMHWTGVVGGSGTAASV